MTNKEIIKKSIIDINKAAGFEWASEYNWKPILGFECSYEISETGVVCSFKRKGKILSAPIDRYGYRKLTLFKNGKRTYTTVHRQVALAFIPNPNNLPEVNHKDGDKLNNHWENLEWCTGENNMKHAHENGLIDYKKISGENCYITKLTDEVVLEIREKMKNGAKNKDIEKEYSLGRSTVSRIRTNKSFKNI